MTKGLAALAGVWLWAGMAAAETTDLKITRVSLFSSGVGYFEREATVSGSGRAELKFRAQQINDILKSLVVQDLDGGHVGVVSYASKDPLERTLKSFAVDLTGNPSLAGLFGQLRGEPVEIAGPRQMTGTIVGVEEQQVPTGKDLPPVTVPYLNVLTDTGLQQLRIDQLQGLKLTNEKLAGELRQALAVLATGHDADKKSVALQFDGEGQRRVRVSFLLEAPIWKTSYRLVLSGDKKPFLQGWATVDNATEEDWKDVRLSLVSGRPISFQMDLYTPIYIPRPVQDLELYASLRAPDFEAGFKGEKVGTGVAMAGEAEGRVAFGRGRTKGGDVKEMAGKALAPATAAPAAPPAPAEAASREETVAAADFTMQLGGRGVQSLARAEEAGELFEYRIDTPVSIGRQNSALLPIVNAEVAGEKLSIFNPASHPKYPLNGLQFENTTGLNLMQGPVTLFDGNVYAGDAKLPDLKPGEKRLIAYALDLGTEVITRSEPVPDQIVSFRIVKGTLLYKQHQVDARTYVIANKDDQKRVLLIEQPYRPGWTLLEPKAAYEQTQNMLRFRVEVPAGKTAEQVVRLEHVLEQRASLSDTGWDAIEVWLKSPVMTSSVKQAIEKVVAMRTDLDTAVRERTQREKDGNEAVQEQGRIRDNLKVIQQGTDTYQRQIKKFDELETQIDKIRGEVTELRRSEEQKRAELQNYLLSLEVQ